MNNIIKRIKEHRQRLLDKQSKQNPICNINRYVWMLVGGILTLILLKALGW